MVTRQVQFCCIFAATKDKFDYFLKKMFHSSTSHTYHHNSSWFLSRHKNIYVYKAKDTKKMGERGGTKGFSPYKILGIYLFPPHRKRLAPSR